MVDLFVIFKVVIEVVKDSFSCFNLFKFVFFKVVCLIILCSNIVLVMFWWWILKFDVLIEMLLWEMMYLIGMFFWWVCLIVWENFFKLVLKFLIIIKIFLFWLINLIVFRILLVYGGIKIGLLIVVDSIFLLIYLKWVGLCLLFFFDKIGIICLDCFK